MKFECESCHAQYMIADEKVGKRGVKVKCKRCSHVIIVRPDGTPEAAPAKESKKGSEPRVEVAERSKVSPTEAPPNLEATSPKPSMEIEKSDVDDRAGESDDVPAPSPLSSPEVTGPARPAPVSMMAGKNDTQLGDSHDDAPADNAKTEMGAAPEPAPEKVEKPVEKTLVAPPPAAPVPDPLGAIAPPPYVPPAVAVKGESSIGDALDDQLAGAFNNMFDEGQRPALADLQAENPEEQRGPTRILDVDAMNALRRQTAAASSQPSSVVDRDALDSLRKDLSPPEESSGLWDDKNKNKGKSKADVGADDGPADAVWHAAIDDEDVGPISLAEMGRHIESGRVDRDSLVWREGMSDWLPAGEVEAVRALFDRVPMPRIAAVEDTAQRKGKLSPSFDVGSPIDDMGGRSPFDNAPPMEESDPAWRPHGLTDVYQAANLAEAAGASVGGGIGSLGGGGGLIGGSAGMSARSGGPSTPPAPAEPEWRPSASSALASLVNDEIDRLSKAPLPADDDDLQPRPADDASLSGSLPFSNLAGMNLDDGAGPDVTDPSLRQQPRAQAQSFDNNQGFQQQGFQQQSFGGPQPFSSPPAPAAPARSPLLYAGIAGGGVVIVLLALLSYKVIFAPPPQVVMIGADGRPLTAMTGPATPTPTPPLTTTPPVATTTPPVATTTPPVATTTPPVTTTTPPTTTTTPPVDATTPPTTTTTNPTLVADATPKNTTTTTPEPKLKTTSTTKVKNTTATTVKDDPPPPPPPPPTGGNKKCDPVLDFDCKPDGKAAATPKVEAKDTLEKSDILAVVKTALPKVKACGQKNKATGTIKMSWRIDKSGKTNDVAIADAKYAGTPTGTCVIGVIKAMKFPASNKPPAQPVSIPLPLG